MKKIISRLTSVFPATTTYSLTMLLFRALVSIELMAAHGLKKIGVGVDVAETVPNPLQLPQSINQFLAIASNLIFPIFIILGCFTRLAALPIVGVTLTGYFILHWQDSLLEKDMPYMYSVAYLLILVLGAGKYSIDYLIYKSTNKKVWAN